MPIYEYRCNACRRKVSVYLRDFSAVAKCPSCGSEDLVRLFSSFAVRSSPKDVYQDMRNDRRLVERLLRNDPKAIADWIRKARRVHPEYELVVDAMERSGYPEEWMRAAEMPEQSVSESETPQEEAE